MSGFAHNIADVWQREIEDTGREPALITLTAFLVTFGSVRGGTHAIRRGRSPFRDVSVRGTHVHHLVWGILLLLVSGFLGIVVNPHLPDWVLPLLFGVGAALTLDEFALWLNLKDVYWTEQGRRSIDAVIVAASLLALSILGLAFWIHAWDDALSVGAAGVAGFQVVGVLLAVLCLGRGHLFEAIVALFFPPAGLVGLVRMATPDSPWARRFYSEDKIAASERRYGPREPDALTWRGLRFRRQSGRGFLLWRGPYWQARLAISVVLLGLLVADLADGRPGWMSFAAALLLIFAVGVRALPAIRGGRAPAAAPPTTEATSSGTEMAADAAVGGSLGGPDPSG